MNKHQDKSLDAEELEYSCSRLGLQPIVFVVH